MSVSVCLCLCLSPMHSFFLLWKFVRCFTDSVWSSGDKAGYILLYVYLFIESLIFSSFTCSFTCNFVCLFIRSFAHSFVHSFIHSSNNIRATVSVYFSVPFYPRGRTSEKLIHLKNSQCSTLSFSLVYFID